MYEERAISDAINPEHLAASQLANSTKLDKAITQPSRRTIWKRKRNGSDSIPGQEHLDRLTRPFGPQLGCHGFQMRRPTGKVMRHPDGLNASRDHCAVTGQHQLIFPLAKVATFQTVRQNRDQVIPSQCARQNRIRKNKGRHDIPGLFIKDHLYHAGCL